MKCNLIKLLGLVTLLSGCSAIQFEFYREEIKHLYHVASKAYKAGDYDKAKTHYQRILNYDEKQALASAALGHIAIAQGQGSEALRYYQRAIRMDNLLKESLTPFLAYAKTMKNDQQVGTIASFEEAVVQAVNNDNQLFKDFSQSIKDKISWSKQQHLRTTDQNKAISRQLLKLQDHFNDCPSCLVLTGFWFATIAEAPHWPLLQNAIDQTQNKNEKHFLVYQLGLSYEKNQQKARALLLYLQYPESEAINKRIQLHTVSKTQ